MAKRGTLDSPKNEMLAATLGTGKGLSFGILTTIWQKATQYYQTGRVTNGHLLAILANTGWTELFPLETIIEALTNEEHKFLDKLDDGSYYIHDWHDHADDTVHSNLYRKIQTFANGDLPKARRIGREEKAELEVKWVEKTNTQPKVVQEASNGQLLDTFRRPTLPCLALPKPSLDIPLPDEQGVCADSVEDFPEEIRQQTAELYPAYCQRRWGKRWKRDLQNEQAQKDQRELAGRLKDYPGAYAKLKAYFAHPPPGRLTTEKLWHIFTYLGLEPGNAKKQVPQLPRQVLKDYTAERLANEKAAL